MIWQDAVTSVCTVFLGIALIPAIKSRDKKPPATTGLLSLAALAGLAVVNVSFGMYMAVLVVIAEMAGYVTLVVQRWRLDQTLVWVEDEFAHSLEKMSEQVERLSGKL